MLFALFLIVTSGTGLTTTLVGNFADRAACEKRCQGHHRGHRKQRNDRFCDDLHRGAPTTVISGHQVGEGAAAPILPSVPLISRVMLARCMIHSSAVSSANSAASGP
jgi:hypothetical protein